ncbi:MAG: hypothetical protein LBU85_00585 [Treponema sp.]|jgi:hypothetical protein|nr:hypothetical protein [Treponema sp.]
MPETYIMPGNIQGEISKNDVIYFGLRGELGYHLDDIFLYILEKHYFPQDADKCRIYATDQFFRGIFNKKILEFNSNRYNRDRPNYLNLTQSEIDNNSENRIPPHNLPYSGLKISIKIPTLAEMIQNLPTHALHKEEIPRFLTANFNTNKVVLVGFDKERGNVTTFQRAADLWKDHKQYIQLSPSSENRVPYMESIKLTNNMRNTVFYSGKAALDAIRSYAIGKSPITEIYFSTHGVVYAIDFNNAPNNLYTSKTNMLQIAGDKWELGESGRLISDMKYLYDTGILSSSVTISMGSCLTGAQVVNINNVIRDSERVKNDPNYVYLDDKLKENYKKFVILNEKKLNMRILPIYYQNNCQELLL